MKSRSLLMVLGDMYIISDTECSLLGCCWDHNDVSLIRDNLESNCDIHFVYFVVVVVVVVV